LPPELEQSIFELTARAYPGNAYTFALVSRRIQVWMEAILYETVTLSSQKVCKSFLHAIKRRPRSFFTANVKSLCIPGDIELDHALSILTVCQGVINLAYWINRNFASPKPWPESHFSVISALRPVRLSINTTGLFGSAMPPDLTHPFFSRVSHLEIVDWPWPVLSTQFELLPSLTHLALDLDSYDEFTLNKLRHIFEACVNLRVLLCLVVDEATMINAISAITSSDRNFDHRLVVLPDSDVIANWESSL
ncbi:hypothetical protein J132_03397, partial [Termitomyces sp. J132]